MNTELFLNDVKDDLVKDLCLKYFNRNFGSISKSEIDLLMFHYYLKQKRINISRNDSHSSNNKDPSDYELSKELGISQSRVRSFKSKDYLQNGDCRDWKQCLVYSIEHAEFVKANDNVELLITDVIVMMELRNFLEQMNLIDEYVLNPKVFKCSVDVFIKVYEELSGKGEGQVFNSILALIKDREPNVETNCKTFKDLINHCGSELKTLIPKTFATYSLVVKICDFFSNRK